MLDFPILIRLIMAATTLVSLMGPTLTNLEPGDDSPTALEPEPTEPDERAERRRLTHREGRASDPALESSAASVLTPTRPTITRMPSPDDPDRNPVHLLGKRPGASSPDVPPGSQYSVDVDKLVSARVISGFGDATFDPGILAIRDQEARYVVNALELVLGDDPENSGHPAPVLLQFPTGPHNAPILLTTRDTLPPATQGSKYDRATGWLYGHSPG